MALLPLLASWRQPLVVLASLVLALSAPASAEKSAADYYVHSLPGAPEGPLLKMHAGYVPYFVQFGLPGIVANMLP
jgi:hypothetical protein